MKKLLTLAVVMFFTAVPAAAGNSAADHPPGAPQSAAPANGSVRDGIRSDASQAKQGVKSTAQEVKQGVKSGAQEVKHGFKTAWAKVKGFFKN